MTENFYEAELSPKTRRIILKHKQHEAKSSKWDYLHHRPPFDEQPHFTNCRLTDIEWQYDKDRFSNPLWAHYKTEKYKTLVAMGLGIYSSRTPNKYRGSSPSNAFIGRRARSSSLGERKASFSPEKKFIKQSFYEFAERRNDDSYATPRKKSFGEHFATLPDERIPTENTSPPKKIRFTESPNSSPSKKKPPISPLKSTGRGLPSRNDKGQFWKDYSSVLRSKSGEKDDFRNFHPAADSGNQGQGRKTKFSPIRSYGKDEMRETASFRTQDLLDQTEPEDLQNCPQPEPLLSTPIRESLETTPNQTRRSRKDRKKIKEEKSQTPSVQSEAFESQTEREITVPVETTPLENQILSSKAKERRSRKERNKNESEVEVDGWSVDNDVHSNSSLGAGREADDHSQSSSLARLNGDPEKLIPPSPQKQEKVKTSARTAKNEQDQGGLEGVSKFEAYLKSRTESQEKSSKKASEDAPLSSSARNSKHSSAANEKQPINKPSSQSKSPQKSSEVLESNRSQDQPQSSRKNKKEISEEKQILDLVQGAKLASLNLVETLAEQDRHPQKKSSKTEGKKQSDDISNEKIEQTTLFYLKKMNERNKSVPLLPGDEEKNEKSNNNSKQPTNRQIENNTGANADANGSQGSIKDLLNTSVSSLKAKPQNGDPPKSHRSHKNVEEQPMTNENLRAALSKSPQRGNQSSRDNTGKSSPVREIKGFDERLQALQQQEGKSSPSRSSQVRTQEVPISQRIENKNISQNQGSSSSLNSSISENPQTIITSKANLRNNDQLAANTFGEGKINYQSKSSSYSDLSEGHQANEDVFIRKSQEQEQKPKRQAPPPRNANQDQPQDFVRVGGNYQNEAPGVVNNALNASKRSSQPQSSRSNQNQGGSARVNSDEERNYPENFAGKKSQPQLSARDYQTSEIDSDAPRKSPQKLKPHHHQQQSDSQPQSSRRPQSGTENSDEERKYQDSHRSQKEISHSGKDTHKKPSQPHSSRSNQYQDSGREYSDEEINYQNSQRSQQQPNSSRINRNHDLSPVREHSDSVRNSQRSQNDNLTSPLKKSSRNSQYQESARGNSDEERNYQDSQRYQEESLNPENWVESVYVNKKSPQKLRSYPQSESQQPHSSRSNPNQYQDPARENSRGSEFQQSRNQQNQGSDQEWDYQDSRRSQNETSYPENLTNANKNTNRKSYHPQSESQQPHSSRSNQGFASDAQSSDMHQKSPQRLRAQPQPQSQYNPSRTQQDQYQDSGRENSDEERSYQSSDRSQREVPHAEEPHKRSSKNLKSESQQPQSSRSNQGFASDAQSSDMHQKSPQKLRSQPQPQSQYNPSRTQQDQYQDSGRENSDEERSYQSSHKERKSYPQTESQQLQGSARGNSDRERSSQNALRSQSEAPYPDNFNTNRKSSQPQDSARENYQSDARSSDMHQKSPQKLRSQPQPQPQYNPSRTQQDQYQDSGRENSDEERNRLQELHRSQREVPYSEDARRKSSQNSRSHPQSEPRAREHFDQRNQSDAPYSDNLAYSDNSSRRSSESKNNQNQDQRYQTDASNSALNVNKKSSQPHSSRNNQYQNSARENSDEDRNYQDSQRYQSEAPYPENTNTNRKSSQPNSSRNNQNQNQNDAPYTANNSTHQKSSQPQDSARRDFQTSSERKPSQQSISHHHHHHHHRYPESESESQQPHSSRSHDYQKETSYAENLSRKSSQHHDQNYSRPISQAQLQQAEPQPYSRSPSQNQMPAQSSRPQSQAHSRSHSQAQPGMAQSQSQYQHQHQHQPNNQSHSRSPSKSQPVQVQSKQQSRPQSQAHSRSHSHYGENFSSDLEAKIQQKLEGKPNSYFKHAAAPQKKNHGAKNNIFKTEVKWNTLYRLREIEDQAARKIQAFYFDRIKDRTAPRVATTNEFLDLVETLKKQEKLYHSIKELLPGQGTDAVNLSIAFISAFCSLKAAKKY